MLLKNIKFWMNPNTLPMKTINTKPIFADFNNQEEDGAVRLDTRGTLHDLDQQNIILKDGDYLWVTDTEIEVRGQVEFRDKIWVLIPDDDGFMEVDIKN